MSDEEARLRRLAAGVAEQMGVQQYTLMIPSEPGESSAPGAASADPTDKTIRMTLEAASPLTDDELAGALAHEFGHLVVPEPLAGKLFRCRPIWGIQLSRVLAGALGASAAVVLATQRLPRTWRSLPQPVGLSSALLPNGSSRRGGCVGTSFVAISLPPTRSAPPGSHCSPTTPHAGCLEASTG